jgi:AcrR family transcriptional regulator
MPRKYEKRRRAAHEEQTRRRIIEALVELHGSIGPARTTIRAVAELAGVQRATVYRHFPSEPSMYAACSAHWAAGNPMPDPAAWSAVRGAGARAKKALDELYAFYARNEAMLSNVFRDESLVEHLRPSMGMFVDYMEAAVCAVAGRSRPSRIVRAAIGHALSFSTWRSLTRDHGLPAKRSAALMATVIEQAMSR